MVRIILSCSSKQLNLLSNDHLFSSKYKSSIFPLTFIFPILPTKSTNTCMHREKCQSCITNITRCERKPSHFQCLNLTSFILRSSFTTSVGFMSFCWKALLTLCQSFPSLQTSSLDSVRFHIKRLRLFSRSKRRVQGELWAFCKRIKEEWKGCLQDEESVRLVSQVSVCCPGFDLQPLRVTSLLPIERLQQARCANVHRLKRAQLQPENLAEFLMIINLE